MTMLLPPILAQIEIPTPLINLGEVAIIAAALLGVVYAIKPLISGFVGAQKELANVNRELLAALKTSDRAQDRAADEIHEFKTALTTQTEALAVLIKGQPEILAQVIKSADRVVVDVNEAADKRDAELKAGLTRLEAAVMALKDEFTTGTKAHRQEMTQKLNEILREISSLKPPPPPHLVKPVEPLELKEKTA
jgi:hypothetical protein